MIAIRSTLFNLVFFVHMITIMVVVTPVVFFLPRSFCVAVVRGWARRSLWLLRVVCGTRVEFRGRERLPDGPFILAHKHQSLWETFALFAVMKDPCWIVKRELLFVPIFGLWALKAGMIYVTRGARSAALKQIVDGSRRALQQGRPVLVAPEGTRRLPGASPAYKFGIVHLYRELDVPIVPAALNSGIYWPWWRFLRFPGRIVVSFLPPIAPGLSSDDFRNRLIAEIEGECDRLLLEADDAVPRTPFGPEATARLATLRVGGRGQESSQSEPRSF